MAKIYGIVRGMVWRAEEEGEEVEKNGAVIAVVVDFLFLV